MSVFTSMGSGLWSWPPFRRLERHPQDLVGRCTKLFWIALYTSDLAKLGVPGLFLGSVHSIAEATHIPADDVRTYLDRLVEDELIEWDVESRVVRMTQLPDVGEFPTNGKAIHGWWRRFQTMPDCHARNAHVATLRWLLDEWSHRNAKPLHPGHEAAWEQTFGRIQAPGPRKRSPRHEQTELFANSGPSRASENADREINTLVSIELNPIETPERQEPEPEPESSSLGSGSSLGSSSPGGVGGDLDPAAGKVLRFVPPVPMFDADDLADALARATGTFPPALPKPQRLALQRAIDALSPIATPADGSRVLAQLCELLRKRGAPTPDVIAEPGWLAEAIELATRVPIPAPAPKPPTAITHPPPGHVSPSADVRHRSELVERFRTHLSAARAEIIARHGIDGALGYVTLHGGENETELRQRLADAGGNAAAELEHVMACAIAEADVKKNVDWLGWNLGRSRVWDRFLRTTPQSVASSARTAMTAGGDMGSVFDAVDQAVADHKAGRNIL